MLMDYIFSHLWGWVGITGIIIAACVAVAIIVPQFRGAALAIAAAAVGATSIYAKGQRDRAALEQKRKEEAVRKAREAYDKIDARPDDPESADKRLRDGSF